MEEAPSAAEAHHPPPPATSSMLNTLVAQLLEILKEQIGGNCLRLVSQGQRSASCSQSQLHQFNELLGKCIRLEKRLLEWKKELDDLQTEIAWRSKATAANAKHKLTTDEQAHHHRRSATDQDQEESESSPQLHTHTVRIPILLEVEDSELGTEEELMEIKLEELDTDMDLDPTSPGGVSELPEADPESGTPLEEEDESDADSKDVEGTSDSESRSGGEDERSGDEGVDSRAESDPEPESKAKDHLEDVNSQVRKCGSCSAKFHSEKDLVKHWATTHKLEEKTRMVKAKIRKNVIGRRRTRPPSPVRQRQPRIDGEKRLKYTYEIPVEERTCPECSRIFVGPYEMKRHLRDLHDPERGKGRKGGGIYTKPPVRCDLDNCGFVFPNRPRAKAHQLKAHGVINQEALTAIHPPQAPAPTQFKCTEPDCEAQFKYPRGLDEHVKNFHRGHEPVECRKCGLTMPQRQLQQHNKNFHSKFAGRTFTCEKCGKCIKRVDSFKDHQRICGADNSKADPTRTRLPCPHPECDKTFASRKGLRTHVKLHTGKPFICDECGRAFTTNSCLKSHKRSHHEHGAADAGTTKTKTGEKSRRNLKQVPCASEKLAKNPTSMNTE